MPDHPIIAIGQYSIAGRKARNDDSYGVLVPRPPLIASKGIAIAIADGMSAAEGAKEASETLVRSFLEDYYATPESWSVKTSAARILNATNRWLNAQSVTLFDSDRGLVSTFTGAVIKAGQAHVFHVGDSRVSLLRGGALDRLTRDHRIRVSRSQDYLSRAVGIDGELEVDYRAVPLDAGDILIFTTDGVHDHIAERDVLGVLAAAGDDLDAAARELVHMAHAAGSPDNLTCQIIRIDAPGLPDRAARRDRLATLPFPPELDAGQMFEGFRILRELHASSRSQVYLAEDPASGEKVALKTPSLNHVDDAGYVERFAREEWVGRLIASPHVLRLREPAATRRHLYLVGDWIEGSTLAQWLADNPRPPLGTVRAIAADLVKGLRAFHRKDILHQDLKPDNIMITAVILDFGSVRVAGIGDIQAEDVKLGTLDYSAPEYLTGGGIDWRADLYALAAIVYTMLSGALPYGKGFASAADVRRARYRPLRPLNPSVPEWVDAAIAKAVALEPSRRHDALSAFLADLSTPNPDLAPLRSRPFLQRDPAAVWRAIALIMTALTIVLLVHALRH